LAQSKKAELAIAPVLFRSVLYRLWPPTRGSDRTSIYVQQALAVATAANILEHLAPACGRIARAIVVIIVGIGLFLITGALT
jgi:hypothetical protein